MRNRCEKACLFLSLLLLSSSALAQLPTPDAMTAAGVAIAPVYGAGLEQYNAFNGSLIASLPLHHIGGRGEAGFDLVWNLQPGWLAAYNGNPGNAFVVIDPYPSNNIAGAGNAFGLGGPGAVYIRTGFAWTACSGGGYGVSSTLTSITFVMPNGGQLSLTDTATNGKAEPVPFTVCSNPPVTWNAGRGTSFRSTDNSQIQFNASSNVLEQAPNSHGYGLATVSGTLVFPNGMKYTVTNSVVTQIEDRNGNIISLYYGGPQTPIDWYLSVPALTQITDSLSRITTINYDDTSSQNNCNGCLTITYPGTGGASRVVKVITGSLGNNNFRTGSSYALTSIGMLFPTSGQTSAKYNPTVASSVILPDGSEYSFQYNPYGELARVNLPPGGTIDYDYVDGTGGANGGYQTNASGGIMVYRRLATRKEYANGNSSGNGTATSETTYTVSYNGSNHTGPTVNTVTVYPDDSGNKAALSQTVHTFQGSPIDALSMTATGCNSPTEGLETTTATGYPAALVTVTNTYTNGSGSSCAYNPQLTTKLTTNDANQQSQISYTYDSYGNVTDEKDYDWGSTEPGGLLRELATAYWYQQSSSYSAANTNLIRLPWTLTTKDGGGNQLAQTVWQYDNYQLANATVSVGHDSAYGTGNTIRGNLNYTYEWLTGSTFLGQSMTYDIAGNQLSYGYDNGTTLYGYNDDNLGFSAFPTSIKDGAGNKTTLNYDYNASKPTSVKDARGNTTTYAYADPLDRLTTITEPTGALSNLYYSPTLFEQTHSQTSSTYTETQIAYDGFGRDIEDRQLTDLQHLVAVDHDYGPQGLVVMQTNPSLVTISGWTNDGLAYQTWTTYDSLGRPTAVQTPDGNTTTTTYSGNATVVTDASSHATKTVTDALGRITSTIEDNGGVSFQTLYTYNALGNLLTVLKCAATGCGTAQAPTGQARSFQYDALGRMTTAVNPESGTVSYSYAANGVNKLPLQARLDGSGQAVYGYDADDRLTSVTYGTGSPTQSYSFDANGNLTQAVLNNVTNAFPSYDANNRPLTSNVQIGGQTYTFSYTYDLAGDLTAETYPSGRVMNTTYDMAMRPLTTNGVQSGTTTPYVQQVGYYPSGAVNYWQYGNNVWPVENLNKVLKPWFWYSIVADNYKQYLSYSSYYWSPNNVTLAGSTECFTPTTSVAYSALSCFTNNNTYDNINRLTAVSSALSSGVGYTQSFQYDEFGNRATTATTGSPAATSALIPSSLTAFNRATNQFVGTTYNYDGRGNMTAMGAVSMAYDGESRQTQTVDGTSGQTANYLYDGLGQRVQKQISSGATTVYVHDAFGKLAAEYNSAGVAPACKTCYLSYDALGSVRFVTNGAAVIIAHHDYLPFGEEVTGGAAGRTGGNFGVSTNVNQMFTGQERDGGTAMLDYFNARHYSAYAGGFMQPDPGNAGANFVRPQSWNAYAYVLGNPLGLVDPSGMGGETPQDCSNCVTVDGGSGPPVDTWAWWMNGGWRSLVPSLFGGSDPVFTATGLAKADVPTVSASVSGTLSPAKNGNDQVKRNVACTADALVSFGLSTFVPGYAAAKTVLGAFDVSVNPVQAALGYKPLISAGPTIPSAAAGASSGYWLYQQSVFGAAGGQARLDRLTDLTSRTFSGAANAAKYGSELNSLQGLAKAANFAGRVTGVLSAVSAGYDIYTCWAGN